MKDMEENKESLQPQDDKREKVKVILLAVIAVCLVTIVIQNFFPTEREVSGNMWLDGGYVSVDGGYVNVGGEVSVGNLGSTTDFQSGLIKASYNVGSDAIPVKLVGVEINDLQKEQNCVPIDIRMVRGYDVNYSSYGVPVKVK